MRHLKKQPEGGGKDALITLESATIRLTANINKKGSRKTRNCQPTILYQV